MASSSWWYYFSKYIDLFDTLFFVLRKKKKQLSFLHVFHHSSMLLNSYLGLKYLPGGQAVLTNFLNSLVHTVMYTYYLLSAMGPQFQKYLWWKRYLTMLQLMQFFAILGHVALHTWVGCQMLEWLKMYVVCYVSFLTFLFLDFYWKSYSKPESVRSKRRTIFTMFSCSACDQFTYSEREDSKKN